MHSPIQCPKREKPNISEEAFIQIDNLLCDLANTIKTTADNNRETVVSTMTHLDYVRKIVYSMVKK